MNQENGIVSKGLTSLLMASIGLVIIYYINQPLAIVREVNNSAEVKLIQIGPPSYSRYLSLFIIGGSSIYSLFILLKLYYGEPESKSESNTTSSEPGEQ